MRKYVDYASIGILGVVGYLMLGYKEVKYQTTLTFIISPLYQYYFIYIPILLILLGYFCIRISLYKGSLEINHIVKRVFCVSLVLAGVIYFGSAMLVSYRMFEVNENVIGIIRGVLIKIYPKHNHLFLLGGAIFAILVTSTKCEGR